MRPGSSTGAGGGFRDAEADRRVLRSLAAALAATRPEVRAVVLFGSLAREDWGRRSDADLLVLLAGPRTDRPYDRIPEFLRAFLEAPCPVDVIVLTVDELRALEAEGRRFPATVRREGIVLAGKM